MIQLRTSRFAAAAAAVATVGAGLAVPTFASAQAAPGARAGVFNCAATGQRQEAGALIGGAVGALAGRALARNERTLGTVIGAVAGAAAGSWIGCRLQISDQQKAQVALERALAENRSQAWSSATARGAVDIGPDPAAVAPLQNASFAPGVMQLASYTHDQVGPHTARSTVNIRAGAGTNTPVVGRLTARQQVNVIAEAPGGAWVLVESGGVARGYVSRSLLTPVGGMQQARQECRMVRETISPVGLAEQATTMRACRSGAGPWTLTPV